MTGYSHELRRLAATLDEAKQEINLTRQQSTKRHHLYVRARRSAVQAARAVVAAVDAGFSAVWPPGVWILSSMRDPDDPSRQPAIIQTGDFKAQLHSMEVGSGCNPDGSLPDDTAYAMWLQWISPSMRSKRRTSKADAGAFDFPAAKTDEQGRILGRDGKPLERIDTMDPETGEPAGWKLNGPAAHVTDDYDEVDALEHLRCQAADWADACDVAADLIRTEAQSADLYAAERGATSSRDVIDALIFFPSRNSRGNKPYPEWKSHGWPKDVTNPASVLAWLDYYTADGGPLAMKSLLCAHNPKKYDAEKSRQWLLDDAYWLAGRLALASELPNPPPQPMVPKSIAALRIELERLRRWIAEQFLSRQPSLTNLVASQLSLGPARMKRECAIADDNEAEAGSPDGSKAPFFYSVASSFHDPSGRIKAIQSPCAKEVAELASLARKALEQVASAIPIDGRYCPFRGRHDWQTGAYWIEASESVRRLADRLRILADGRNRAQLMWLSLAQNAARWELRDATYALSEWIGEAIATTDAIGTRHDLPDDLFQRFEHAVAALLREFPYDEKQAAIDSQSARQETQNTRPADPTVSQPAQSEVPVDLLTTGELAYLAIVGRDTFNKRASECRQASHQGIRPPDAISGGNRLGSYSYAAIRPWLCEQWDDKVCRFPESFAEVKQILAHYVPPAKKPKKTGDQSV